jgi:malate synthase
VAPGTGVSLDRFYSELELTLEEFEPTNFLLLKKRERFQEKLDQYHKERRDQNIDYDAKEYVEFLKSIDYLVDSPEEVQVCTQNTDPELYEVAGPQLVVPVNNARFALNATNARWGSLYNAYYGAPGFLNLIDEDHGKELRVGYNPKRGEAVVSAVNRHLDEIIPLKAGLFTQLKGFEVEEKNGASVLSFILEDGQTTTLKNPDQWCGFTRGSKGPRSLIFKNNHLHLELVFDRSHPVGAAHPAGLADVLAESAITTIQDFEDSVAAVDAEDKLLVYKNWHGLMTGRLCAEVPNEPGGKRRARGDRKYIHRDGQEETLKGRSLLMVRNVGLHMMTDAVHFDGRAIPEGILDLFICAWSAKRDLPGGSYAQRNSKAGSIYVVKPKLHGPEEVKFTVDLFARAEEALVLPPKTIKLGLMDEEQRTTLNLKACVAQACDRLFFINTGFLDRTGDMLATQRQVGPFQMKSTMKAADWLEAYENNNVQVGLEAGLHKVGQIGKGMWAENRNSKGLLAKKQAQVESGASTAWVPSPTMATLHVLHYHRVDVHQKQTDLENYPVIQPEEILSFPLMENPKDVDLNFPMQDYAQSILGYVVRWIDQGVGCSSVPDMSGTYLMEDRATLRISSQLLNNWMIHGLIDEKDLQKVFSEKAVQVDDQNKNDRHYKPMCPELNGTAFIIALELVLSGYDSKSGYVEPLLHKGRTAVKLEKEVFQLT